jgi:hypothetical protein
MNRLLAYLFVLQLVFSPVCVATDYYVDKTLGDDSAAGTSEAHPWEYCPNMAGWTGSVNLADGDTVYFKRGETWPLSATRYPDSENNAWGALHCRTSGVTYDAYGDGDRPVLQLNTTGSNYHAVIQIRVGGVYLKNLDIDMNDQHTNGISMGYIYEAADDILIEDCIVRDSVIGPNPDFGYAIHVGPYKEAYLLSNVVIRDCLVYNTGHEGIAIYPSNATREVSNVSVYDTIVHTTGTGGSTWGDGIYITNDSSDILVDGCEVYNSSSRGLSIANKGESTAPTNVTVRNTVVRDNANYGIGIAGDAVSPIDSEIYIYNNFVYGNDHSQLYFINDYASSDIHIYNNTFYHDISSQAAVYMTNSSSTVAQPIKFKNNIVFSTSGYALFWYASAEEGYFDHSNNLIYRNDGTANWAYDGTARANTWITGTWDATSKITDPNFIDANGDDFDLDSPSDAINNGADLSEYFTTDYQGDTRDANFDIGADEYGVDAPTPTITGCRIQ